MRCFALSPTHSRHRRTCPGYGYRRRVRQMKTAATRAASISFTPRFLIHHGSMGAEGGTFF
ncbi:hypothetical protein LNP74_05210 [Klebsiella pneumoniae subsp. pneumoniae]|nr:hypothetical protein [Klebsiella pneumoniae subsp. pneumoniae]